MKNVSRFGSTGLQLCFFFLIGVLCCGVEKCCHMETEPTHEARLMTLSPAVYPSDIQQYKCLWRQVTPPTGTIMLILGS